MDSHNIHQLNENGANVDECNKSFFSETRTTRINSRKQTMKKSFFVIKSKHALSSICFDALDFLHDNCIWLNSTPGPLSVAKVRDLGMLIGIPSLAHLPIIQNNITNIVKKKMETTSEDINMDDDNIIENHDFVVHMQKEKIKASYNNHQIKNNNNIVVHSSLDAFNKNSLSLEKHTKALSVMNIRCILFTFRNTNPNGFRKLLCKGINIANSYRNIAVCGTSPEVMDQELSNITETTDMSKSLWNSLHTSDGVHRVDPTRRTLDLRKWHLSVHKDKCDTVCTKINNILNNLHFVLPQDFLEKETFQEFPHPQHLHSTISSGQTVTSSKHASWLLDSCPTLPDISPTIITKNNNAHNTTNRPNNTPVTTMTCATATTSQIPKTVSTNLDATTVCANTAMSDLTV